MAQEFLHGQTVENTKDNIITIKNKEKDYFYGQMEDNMTVNGKMENKKEKECTRIKTVILNKVSGKKVKNLDGSITISTILKSKMFE